MTEKIAALAAELGGTEAGPLLESLCAAAEAELRALLRPGVAPEDCGDAFVLAAAWMALADRETAAGAEQFTAGAVTIRRGEASQRRQALRLQARQVMKPYLRDESFVFRGVES